MDHATPPQPPTPFTAAISGRIVQIAWGSSWIGVHVKIGDDSANQPYPSNTPMTTRFLRLVRSNYAVRVGDRITAIPGGNYARWTPIRHGGAGRDDRRSQRIFDAVRDDDSIALELYKAGREKG